MNSVTSHCMSRRVPVFARTCTTQAIKNNQHVGKTNAGVEATWQRPTTTGFLAVKDITPRPPYGPDEHPSYPIVMMRNLKTAVETPYMVLGYTGKDAAASQDIIQRGLTTRVFTTLHYMHAFEYVLDGGKIFTLGIDLDTFVNIANRYNHTQTTVADLMSSSHTCNALQQTDKRFGNILGFEADDISDACRDSPSMYRPLRRLITQSSILLDIKDPKNKTANSLDLTILNALDKSGQYERDHSWLNKMLPSSWVAKLERRPDLEGLSSTK